MQHKKQFRLFYDGLWSRWYDFSESGILKGLKNIKVVEISETMTYADAKKMLDGFDR